MVGKRLVTSDTHFCHKNICGPKLSKWKEGYRNFSSLEEMEDVIVNNLNRFAQPDDIIYHHGDVFMGQVELNAKRIRERIKCQTIHLIYGNHDEKIRKNVELQRLFASVQDYLEIRVDGTLVCMFHYPMTVWNENGKGAVHLYGHTHGSYINQGKSIEVGVDCWDFKPIELDFAISEAKKKPFYLPDHHGQNTSYH